MRAIRLRTEYLYEPLGIDIKEPRFFWNCEREDFDCREDCVQTAYQITAEKDGEIVWDSGKVLSASMTHIPYGGPALKSRDHICWKVRLWNGDDRPGESAESFFEMGLLKKEDWTAKWISGDYEPQKDTRYPVDYFKKGFSVRKNLKWARLYVSACGLYEAQLNGEKAGDACFTPGCTDYRKRIPYQTYDVTGLLKVGEENSLTFELADGWYRGSINAFGQTEVYGNQTKLLGQLELYYEDGEEECIATDGSFSWSNDGPLRFADFKDGEIFEAGRTPSYSGTARLTTEAVVPSASNQVSVREKEFFGAKAVYTPSGKLLLDFGQNLAGFVDVCLQGKKGQKVTLRMGEILDENGELTLKNIQTLRPVKNFDFSNQLKVMMGQYGEIQEELVCTPLQEVRLTLSGGEDHYRTKYALFGFRYAEVVSDGEVDSSGIRALAVYSDMEPLGSFTCGNPKVNQLVKNALWSMKSNFLDIPTDCPTRERLGWTGDAQIFFNSAAWLMDTAAFFRKWLEDMEDSQYEDGSLPAVLPYAGLEMMYKSTGSSVGWHDAGILIPWRYYLFYRDERILRRHYGMMKKCAMFMIKNAGPKDEEQEKENPWKNYMYVKGVQLGEWLEPKEFQDTISAGQMPEHPEECTAYMHYSMEIMAKTAAILNQEEDRALFQEYADGAKQAYQWMFLRNGAPDTDRQAKLVRPLALGLTDGEMTEAVQKRLVQAVENYQYCVETGFLSTPFLLPELTKAGRADVAYRVLTNEKAPGWLSEINAGATTVWENWDGEGSRNHYSPGAVCEWLFREAAGITVDGENHFHIEPVMNEEIGYVSCSYLSMYGEVQVHWKAGEKPEVKLPPNTEAEVVWK